jgi:hypothetical protein
MVRAYLAESTVHDLQNWMKNADSASEFSHSPAFEVYGECLRVRAL